MVRGLFLIIFYSLACGLAQAAPEDIKLTIGEKLYSCPPCDHHSGYLDDLYHQHGVCPSCNMKLIAKPNFSTLDQPILKAGSGNFVMTGGASCCIHRLQINKV